MTTETNVEELEGFFRWEDTGLGRKRISCPRCTTPIELRLMDDLLEAACPSCGRGPFFERAREIEIARGAPDTGRLLEKLGILTAQEVSAATETMDPSVPASADDEASGLVGAARALGLFAKSLYLAVAPGAREDDKRPPRLVARPLRELIGPEQLREALDVERREGVSVGEAVATLALRAEKDVLLTQAGDDAHIDLDGWVPPPQVLALIPAGMAASYLAVPVRLDKDGALVVAVRDPLDFTLLDNLKFMTGRDIRALSADESALFRALERLYAEKDLREGGVPAEPSADDLKAIEAEELADAVSGGLPPGVEDHEAADQPYAPEAEAAQLDVPDEPPGERTLNLLLLQAAEERAEQVILEPLDDAYRVRFRRSGRLREVARLPQAAGEAAIERAMVLGGMDATRRTRAQRGTMRLSIAGEALEIDAATTPAALGSALSLAIRDASFRLLALDAIALVPGDSALLRELLSLPPGLTIVSAPEGEGKTTLLYAMLRDVDRAREQVISLERRVRARVEGAVQLAPADYAEVAAGVGELRPDRVFIDDLLGAASPTAARDEVRLALDLAYRGARVVATVTAPDPVAAVGRLAASGVETAVLLAPLRAVVGLRLVKRICPRCREEFEADPDMELPFGIGEQYTRRLSVGIGCWECSGTGYRGRAALTEVIPIDEPIRDGLRILDRERVRARATDRGARGLPEKALISLRSGLTSVSQVERIMTGK